MDFHTQLAAMTAVEAAIQPDLDNYRDHVKTVMEAVIKDIGQAYAITGWSFCDGDGYNDEGRRWLEYYHYIEVDESKQTQVDYLEDSSAHSLTGVLDMLEGCECREINPRKIKLTDEQMMMLNKYFSDPFYVFNFDGTTVTWLS